MSASKEQVLAFVKSRYDETGVAPSMRQITEGLDVSLKKVYSDFPGGVKEICEGAEVPLPKERVQSMEKVQKARESKRTLSSREIGGDLAARVFPYFQKKTPLTKIVMELKLGPDTVQQLHRKWLVLERIDVGQQPAVKEQLTTLGHQVEWLLKNVSRKSDPAFNGLRNSFRCRKCGSIHKVAVKIMCTSCQNETWTGWWPESNGSGQQS